MIKYYLIQEITEAKYKKLLKPTYNSDINQIGVCQEASHLIDGSMVLATKLEEATFETGIDEEDEED